MNEVKVVFIGGLTNGRVVLDYLRSNKYVDVPLVITHPADCNVPRYVDVAEGLSETRVICDLDANKHIEEIRNESPDFIFVAGWSGLLSEELVGIGKNGTIGFHPSKLPKDRGRSVLAWQIEEGHTETALTMFYYNQLPDCGDIIAQEAIKIEGNDYISDVLDKVDEASYSLMRAYFPLLRRGIAPSRPQDINEGNFRRLRTERDSEINWDRNARVIYDKIRSISRPYPGAFFYCNGEKVRVWRSEMIDDEGLRSAGSDAKPGSILQQLNGNEYVIKCRDGMLKVLTEAEVYAELNV